MTEIAATKNQNGGGNACGPIRRGIPGLSALEILREARIPYRRLFGYLGPHRDRFALGIGFGVLSGLFSVILLMGLKLVLGVVLGDNTAWPFNGLPDPWANVAVCSLIPVLVLGRGLLSYLHDYCMMWAGTKILHRLRDELFANLLRQSLSFYHRAKTGELIQTLFNLTRLAQGGAIRVAGDLVKHPVSILAIVGFLLSQDWKYTLAGLFVFPACILPVLATGKRVREAAGRGEKSAGTHVAATQETLRGIRVVKSYAREEYEQDRFNLADLRTLKHVMRWNKAVGMIAPLVETVAAAGIAAGLVYAKLTHMSPETFILLNLGLIGIYPHARALGRLEISLEESLAATSKVLALIDRTPDIVDAPDTVIPENPKGEIEFREARFRYPGGQEDAIKPCSVKFKAGQSHALIGRSGSGKSTLLALIPRFHDPAAGSITFDGIDLRRISQRSLRDHIGVVNQDVFLFRDTLYNNILYGNPGATKPQVIDAARRAHAHDFILEKPGGYQAVVGEAGCILSGGQQQLVSIARAILHNAPVLLLDEAYSGLDPDSEQKIQEAMEDLSRGKTVIAIAHRQSTLLKADQILVLDGGRIVDAGTHAELLARNELYQHLYNLQFPSHDLASAPTMATI